MKIIEKEQVRQLLTPEKCIEAMETALADGVWVVIGKFFDFIDAPFREVDFPGATDIHIAIRNAESFLCVIQLTLVGSADNQNHVVPSYTNA